jgi:hypothetical protein
MALKVRGVSRHFANSSATFYHVEPFHIFACSVTLLQPSALWDAASYSLHWQSISLSELCLGVSDADAAADVSLVSGKVRAVLLRGLALGTDVSLQLRSFAPSSCSVTDVVLAPTAALV